MNGRLFFLILVFAAACSTPRQAERVARVPPLPIEKQPIEPVVHPDATSRAEAEESAPAPLAEVRQPVAETPSAAPQSNAPIYRSVVRTAETPAPETPRVEQQESTASEPAGTQVVSRSRTAALPPHVSFHAGVYHDRACGYFPVHTVIGTSIGAAIGSHHGNAHRGAAIGGTVGFFLDMGRAFH